MDTDKWDTIFWTNDYGGTRAFAPMQCNSSHHKLIHVLSGWYFWWQRSKQRGCGCSVCLMWISASFYLLGMLEDKHIPINIALKTWKIIPNVIFSISPAELQHAKQSVLCNIWPQVSEPKDTISAHSWNKVIKNLISTAMHWNKMCGLQIKANLNRSMKWHTILVKEQNDPVHPLHDPFPKPVRSPWCHVWSHIHVPHFAYFDLSLPYDHTVMLICLHVTNVSTCLPCIYFALF
jgi:hypothetical protein